MSSRDRRTSVGAVRFTPGCCSSATTPSTCALFVKFRTAPAAARPLPKPARNSFCRSKSRWKWKRALPSPPSIPSRCALPMVRGGQASPVVAIRVPGRRNLYRTGFFPLGGRGLTFKPGTSMIATLDQHALLQDPKIQFVSIPYIAGTISLTPGIEHAGATGGALEKCCSKRPRWPMFLPRIWRLSPVTAREKKIDGIDVTIGDHAAMLLLRDNFVEMMQEQLDWLNYMSRDRDVEKFRAWVKPYVLYQSGAYYGEPHISGGQGGIPHYQISKLSRSIRHGRR